MNYLKIPYQDIQRLVQFSKLNGESKKIILNEIANYNRGTLPEDFIEHVSKVVPMKLIEAQDIFSLVVNLLNTKNAYNESNDNFFKLLSKSLNEIENYTNEEKENFLVDLKDIIFNTGKEILVSITAIGLLTDNSKVFLSSNILHDLKPIFVDNIVEGAVIANKLKIEYKENDVDKEIFLTLDEKDLEALKKSIEIAEIKLLSLKDKANVNIINF